MNDLIDDKTDDSVEKVAEKVAEKTVSEAGCDAGSHANTDEKLNKSDKKEHRKLPLPLAILIYCLCAALVISYLTILWIGTKPNVGREYKMYYITHELTDWPGYGGLWYGFNEVEYCVEDTDKEGNIVTYNVCKRAGKGWTTQQRFSGTTNTEDESVLYYVAGVKANNAELTISVKNFTGKNPVEVYIDDVKVGEFDSNGSHEFSLGNIDKDRFFTIRFVSNDTKFTLWAVNISKD